jgi:hypothetical protein
MKAIIFHIQESDSIQSVQHRFGALFPSMQISFFRDPDKLRQTDQCIMYSGNTAVGEINPGIKDLVIEITPSMRVTDFENKIRQQGLHAQISCRIIDRRAPDSSVSNWFLNDVYGVDNPHPFSTINNQSATRF